MSKESNKLLIREKLIKVAFNFSKKGVDNTTVSEIIKKADIGRGTFYNYFSDVNHIFDSIIEN